MIQSFVTGQTHELPWKPMSCYGDVSIQRSHLINKIRDDFELDTVLILIKAPSLKIHTHMLPLYVYILDIY